MEEKTASHLLPSSSRSRVIYFTLLGGTLLLALVLGGAVKINLFQPTDSSRRGDPTMASSHDPTSSGCGQGFDPEMGGRGNSGGAMRNPGRNSNFGGVQSTNSIPFFGNSADDDTMSTSWSHLDHRVEEYRNDLVKAVEVGTRCVSVALMETNRT